MVKRFRSSFLTVTSMSWNLTAKTRSRHQNVPQTSSTFFFFFIFPSLAFIPCQYNPPCLIVLQISSASETTRINVFRVSSLFSSIIHRPNNSTLIDRKTELRALVRLSYLFPDDADDEQLLVEFANHRSRFDYIFYLRRHFAVASSEPGTNFMLKKKFMLSVTMVQYRTS